jgi:hypothetical protein
MPTYPKGPLATKTSPPTPWFTHSSFATQEPVANWLDGQFNPGGSVSSPNAVCLDLLDTNHFDLLLHSARLER